MQHHRKQHKYTEVNKTVRIGAHNWGSPLSRCKPLTSLVVKSGSRKECIAVSIKGELCFEDIPIFAFQQSFGDEKYSSPF
ncbi:hypothetical protein AQ505_00620 [Pedobacter sp. PACM 27299]|nr:hypothetical protein AQ505_00620 [Pedobacter sp. PACM 27299]